MHRDVVWQTMRQLVLCTLLLPGIIGCAAKQPAPGVQLDPDDDYVNIALAASSSIKGKLPVGPVGMSPPEPDPRHDRYYVRAIETVIRVNSFVRLTGEGSGTFACSKPQATPTSVSHPSRASSNAMGMSGSLSMSPVLMTNDSGYVGFHVARYACSSAGMPLTEFAYYCVVAALKDNTWIPVRTEQVESRRCPSDRP